MEVTPAPGLLAANLLQPSASVTVGAVCGKEKNVGTFDPDPVGVSSIINTSRSCLPSRCLRTYRSQTS